MKCTSDKKGACRKCPLGKNLGETVVLTTANNLPTKTAHVKERRPDDRINYVAFYEGGCFIGWANPNEYMFATQQELKYIG